MANLNPTTYPRSIGNRTIQRYLRAYEKVIQFYVETYQFRKIDIYVEKVNFVPDYVNWLKLVVAKMEDVCDELDDPLAYIDKIVNKLIEKGVVHSMCRFEGVHQEK